MTEFIFSERVYIEDTDFTGIVYHANYLKFFERARSEWAECLGFGADWQCQQRIYFPVRSIQIDFLKPAKLFQQLEVVSRIVELRKASIVYDQYLRLKATPDTILCKAKIKVACVNEQLRPRALPEIINSLIIEYTGEQA